MELQCFLNGKLVPLSEGKVSVYDIGLLRGFGIYEAMTTYHRKPFMFADHLQRFRASADKLSLKIPFTDEELREAIRKLIETNVPADKEAVIRFILTGGPAIGGIEYDFDTPTFYVLVEELQPLARSMYEEGCGVTVREHLRQLPECKTIDYLEAVLLQKSRREAGALEILYTHQGNVLECATSNFFIVRNGTVITPRENILYGITRKVALDLARKEFPIEERAITTEEMYEADEAFLTSSFKEVVPVVSIGEKTIADGKPGPVTKRIAELFREFAKNY